MISWPTNLTDASYNTTVLNAITQNNFEVVFANVSSSIPGHTATFRIFSDALKIDGTRINVSAYLEQQIADALGCMLLTPKLADLLYAARAVTLVPYPMPIASTAAAMVSESQKIDAALSKLGGVEPGQVVQTTGKHWCVSNALSSHAGMAENYGWFMAKGTPSPWQGVAIYPSVTLGAMVIQQPSWAHDPSHLDYSQQCSLVHRRCTVDGQDRDLYDVLKDPTLAALASHEGVLSVFRQPGVPLFSCPLPAGAAPSTSEKKFLVAPAPSGLCPTPPLPDYGGPPSSTDWTLVAACTVGLAAVVGGFALALRHAGRVAG